MDDDTRTRFEALEAEVRELRETVARLEADLLRDLPSFRAYRPTGLEVRTLQIQTGCSLNGARDALIASRGDLLSAIERIQRLGLAST